MHVWAGVKNLNQTIDMDRIAAKDYDLVLLMDGEYKKAQNEAQKRMSMEMKAKMKRRKM